MDFSNVWICGSQDEHVLQMSTGVSVDWSAIPVKTSILCEYFRKYMIKDGKRGVDKKENKRKGGEGQSLS